MNYNKNNFKMNFEEYCKQEGFINILDRWDYEKNDKLPSEVAYKSHSKYWIKCPRGIHKSSLKRINGLGRNNVTNIPCVRCESFAQWLLDNYNEEYLELLQSLNPEIDFWIISKGSKQKIHFQCFEKEYHKYDRTIVSMTKNTINTCGYCSHNLTPPYKEDSLGSEFGDIFKIWSDKNEKTPYDYYSNCDAIVWWKCEKGIHEDYKRKICNSKNRDYRCPKCGLDLHDEKMKERQYDITGKVFGELTVLYKDYDKSYEMGTAYWVCKCSCGTIKTVRGAELKNGKLTTCGNNKIHWSGENSPTWKGGLTSLNIRGKNNSDYHTWRNAVYVKDWYTCQCCGKSKDIIKNAHHILPYAEYEDLRYDVDNGITMCKECHYTTIKDSFHNKYGTINNTPEQLEEFINWKRKQLGIDIPFSLEEYRNGNILKPLNIKKEETNKVS